MNKIIAELANQCTYQSDGCGEQRFDKEKFANLILDHCCLIAMSEHQSSDFDSYDELDPYDRGGDDVAAHISGRIFSLKSI